MRLVERVREDVQQCQREKPKTTLQHHEPHLRDRRPGERGLDGGLSQHHQASKESRETPDHHEHRQHAGMKHHHVRKANEQKPAGIDDSRVQERGDRRRRLHDLGEPAMSRELCRLQECGQRQQDGRTQRAAVARFGSSGAEDLREVDGAVIDEEQHRCTDQRCITQAGR